MSRSGASSLAMTTTQIRPTERLADLVAGVRTAVDAQADWSEAA
jgi:hypothetical protein